MNESHVNSPYIDPDTGEFWEDAPVLTGLSIDHLGSLARQAKALADRKAELEKEYSIERDRVAAIYKDLIAKCEHKQACVISATQLIMDEAHIEKKHIPGCGRFGWRKQQQVPFETPAWASLPVTEQRDIAADFGPDLFKITVAPVKKGIKEILSNPEVYNKTGPELEQYFRLTADDDKKFGFTVEKGS
jgi:hypothetical protein